MNPSRENTDFFKYLTLIEWKDDSAQWRLKAEFDFYNYEYYSHFSEVGVLYSKKIF